MSSQNKSPPSHSLSWIIKPWPELSLSELYGLIQLRESVFVVEQKCAYLDADGRDPHSTHVFAVDPSHQTIVACARIVPPGLRFADISIGRVVTAAAIRGQGVGRELMQRSLLHLKQQQASVVRISAQKYLEGFYSSLGFKTASAVYLEDGIEHVEMRCDLR